MDISRGRRRHGSSTFLNGFFTIYIIQSVADIGYFLLELVFLRLPRMGCVSSRAFDFPQGNVACILLTYCVNIQFTAHAAIGVNRFFVLIDAWSERKGRITTVIILFLALPTAALRIAGRARLMETGAPGVYSVVRELPWSATVSSLVYHIGMSLVTLVFELLSLIRYKRLVASAREKYRNDFRLLIYALLQFCVQLSIAVCYGLFAIGAVVGDFGLVTAAQSTMNPLSVALCLSPPLCLLSTSKVLRKAWWTMYYPLAKQSDDATTSPVVRMKPSG